VLLTELASLWQLPMHKPVQKIVFNDIKQELVDKGLAAYKAEGIDAKGYVCDVQPDLCPLILV